MNKSQRIALAVGDAVTYADPDHQGDQFFVSEILSESGQVETDDTVVLLGHFTNDDVLIEAYASELR